MAGGINLILITACLGLVSRIGLNPKMFGLHSARSGGAAAGATKGVADRSFNRHGRWVSEKAKEGYVKG